MIWTWVCRYCGYANDNNPGPCRRCGRPDELPEAIGAVAYCCDVAGLPSLSRSGSVTAPIPKSRENL